MIKKNIWKKTKLLNKGKQQFKSKKLKIKKLRNRLQRVKNYKLYQTNKKKVNNLANNKHLKHSLLRNKFVL
jgi:hypothetical protein